MELGEAPPHVVSPYAVTLAQLSRHYDCSAAEVTVRIDVAANGDAVLTRRFVGLRPLCPVTRYEVSEQIIGEQIGPSTTRHELIVPRDANVSYCARITGTERKHLLTFDPPWTDGEVCLTLTHDIGGAYAATRGVECRGILSYEPLHPIAVLTLEIAIDPTLVAEWIEPTAHARRQSRDSINHGVCARWEASIEYNVRRLVVHGPLPNYTFRIGWRPTDPPTGESHVQPQPAVGARDERHRTDEPAAYAAARYL